MSQLWMIEREVTGWSDEDVEAAGIRAKLCVLWYPNMEWIRSFFDREGERTMCFYRAESEADIRSHALATGLPCGIVSPVEEVLPSDLDEPAPEAVAETAGHEGRPPLWWVREGNPQG